MSCGTYNNGWGGCGCQGTVQYAPSACNPNFPTACYPLGVGSIQRVVGEDSASCKYTVATINSNSILFYNASTALISWGDASSSSPVFLGSGSGQATANQGQLQATSPTGQLSAFTPSVSAKTQFPVYAPSGTQSTWGTIDSIVPNTGIVCKSSAIPPSGVTANSVYELSGTSSQVASWDGYGNPVAVAATTFLGTVVPSGAILPFAYNVTTGTVPSGWLVCDGTIYTVASYPSLGALLGNTYGGSTGTFAVPDMRGYFVRGYGTNADGTTSGSFGTSQASSFASHTHAATVTDPGHTHTYSLASFSGGGQAGGSVYTPLQSLTTGTTGSRTTGITVANAATGGTENRPANIAMVYCIKT
jgi:microcystin-dependent protein